MDGANDTQNDLEGSHRRIRLIPDLVNPLVQRVMLLAGIFGMVAGGSIVLWIIGFGGSGVTHGSIASILQRNLMGASISKGSVFGKLQSAGMAGVSIWTRILMGFCYAWMAGLVAGLVKDHHERDEHVQNGNREDIHSDDHDADSTLSGMQHQEEINDDDDEDDDEGDDEGDDDKDKDNDESADAVNEEGGQHNNKSDSDLQQQHYSQSKSGPGTDHSERSPIECSGHIANEHAIEEEDNLDDNEDISNPRHRREGISAYFP